MLIICRHLPVLPIAILIAVAACKIGQAELSVVEQLAARIQSGNPLRGSFADRLAYIKDINRRYDSLNNQISAEELVELRLLRSLWAKRIATSLLQAIPSYSATDLEQNVTLIAALRTLVPATEVVKLVNIQQQRGNLNSAEALINLLAEHAHPEAARSGLVALGASPFALRRLGPPATAKVLPMAKSLYFDYTAWLNEPANGDVEYVNGNVDHVRMRGFEAHSGDIGMVELNHPGDGLFDSFLQRAGVTPHSVVYVTRRVKDAKTGKVVGYRPSVVETFEGGWRCISLATLLHPNFSNYSEWVRPTSIGGKELPADTGERLSDQVDVLEEFAFDFHALPVPKGGYYTGPLGSCATCTNQIRVLFERAGIELPYVATPVSPGALANFDTLGIDLSHGIHTPTDLLNGLGFSRVGVVDNGTPEISYAQALVVGRPELTDTFGGYMSQRTLNLRNLPRWNSVQRWRSALEAMKVKLGQSNGLVGGATRMAFGFTREQVPRAPSTLIAYYLRSDRAAALITQQQACPYLLQRGRDSADLWRLSQLQKDPTLEALIREGLQNSVVVKERWYAD